MVKQYLVNGHHIRAFESVVILDSGKTSYKTKPYTVVFESVVILDSGKTEIEDTSLEMVFESVVILDSGKT